MGASIGLGLYLWFSANAKGRAETLLARRAQTGKEDLNRLNERRGQASLPRPNAPLIWLHAASVGEALSLQELIRTLGQTRPDVEFLLTTGTRSSAQVLENNLPPRTRHQYLPVDIRDYVQAFLDHWRPDMAIWTESELWPRLIYETHRRGVPMLLINARMSARSHKMWRWLPGFARSLLTRFDTVLAQEDITASYLRRLGLPQSRLKVLGTLKEGTAALPCDDTVRNAVAGQLQTRPVWLAASTHPGEEEQVVNAHATALKSSHRLLLILVPRHPERGDTLTETLRGQGWQVAQRSQGQPITPQTQIYMADTLGELGIWYRLSPVAFIGGSLVDTGGHNPYEPAALGSAILHGPHVQNFLDIYDRLTTAKAARQVDDAASLTQAVQDLQSPDLAAQMAHAAWEVSSQGAGVTAKTAQEVLSRLELA
jgi:3-deoxy-D-manno-octulosonic-acid transferase